jgi:hypothetical protein
MSSHSFFEPCCKSRLLVSRLPTLRVFPRVSYNILLLPRRSSCLLLRPLMLLQNVVSFLTPSCKIVPRSLMSLLYSGCARLLFPNVRPFRVPCATLLLVRFSVVSVRPSVLYDRVPYGVPFLHGGSSLCRRRPTSSGTHHGPGVGSHNSASVIRQLSPAASSLERFHTSSREPAHQTCSYKKQHCS